MTHPAFRFAPSPTGFLHLGNIRTALLNKLAAIQLEGLYWLRLDDTDVSRCEARYVDAILEDMAWLGLDVAGVVRQSERLEHYLRATEQLKQSGFAEIKTESEQADR